MKILFEYPELVQIRLISGSLYGWLQNPGKHAHIRICLLKESMPIVTEWEEGTTSQQLTEDYIMLEGKEYTSRYDDDKNPHFCYRPASTRDEHKLVEWKYKQDTKAA